MRRLTILRRRDRTAATLLPIGILASLLAGGCESITPEQARKLGCIAGTFLSVAANNFGGQYLHDASTLVNLFVSSSSNYLPTQATPGCGPSGSETAAVNWTPEAPEEQGYPVDSSYPQESSYSQDADYPGQPEYSEQSDYPEQTGYSQQAEDYREEAQFTLDVALVCDRADGGQSGRPPVPMYDGEILRRDAGDRFQIYLAPSFDAYVYIYAVDSTAWGQQIFPDTSRGHRNPVRAGQEIFLPRPGYHFRPDEHKGVQEIWFLVSPRSRPDVEQLLSQYPMDRERPTSAIRSRSGKPAYQRISQASVFARGLEEVGPGSAATVETASGSSFEMTPARLFASSSEDEIAFSRWFESQ